MQPFDFQLPTQIIFGPGTLSELGEVAASLGAGRVLVVSDPGISRPGTRRAGSFRSSRRDSPSSCSTAWRENPTTQHVDAGLLAAQEFQPDLIVGIGGGSSMDCAKGINFLYSCGGRMQDYWGQGKATGPLLPMIAVPTTAGTGSETQSYALIADAETQVKMACGDKRAAFRAAILDPELTLTQPPRVTALTGIDAISHALETYVTTRRNPMSLVFSREAWRHLSANFGRVLAEPIDLEARAEMQLGAALAGLAIENSMLGAAHALANPLTARLWHCPRRSDRPDVAARDPPQRPHDRPVVRRAARRQHANERGRRRAGAQRNAGRRSSLNCRARRGSRHLAEAASRRRSSATGRGRHRAMDRHVQSRSDDLERFPDDL